MYPVTCWPWPCETQIPTETSRVWQPSKMERLASFQTPASRITFGRHAGKTFEEVRLTDKGYCARPRRQEHPPRRGHQPVFC